MPSPQSLSNKSKKNRNAIKIQAVFRGRKTRRKLQVLQKAKIKDEAERLFGKVNKSKAKQAIIDMGRDVDKERIEYMNQRASRRKKSSSSSWITEYLNRDAFSPESPITQEDLSRIYSLLGRRSSDEPTPEPVEQ